MFGSTAGLFSIYDNAGSGNALTLSAGVGDARFYHNLQIDGRIGISQSSPTAFLDIPASISSAASLRIRSGSAPTTLNDGDIWFDGTNLKIRISGATKTFTVI